MTAHDPLHWASEVRGFSIPHGFAAFVQHEGGQDVVEYGILIATIAVVVLLGVTTFGQQITPWFTQLAGHITTVGT